MVNHQRITVRWISGALALCLAASLWAADAANEPENIITFLNQSIVWYQQQALLQQLANQPSDVIFLNDSRQQAEQIVQLSFDFARARAPALGATAAAGAGGGAAQASPGSSQYQALTQMLAKVEKQVEQTQAEVQSFKHQLNTATGRKRKMLESTIAETQSELDLQQARRDTVRSMMQFASGTGVSPGNLASQVEELSRTVLVASDHNKSAATEGGATIRPAASQVTVPAAKPAPSGIWGQISDVFALRRKTQGLDDAAKAAASLEDSATEMRSPLATDMKDLVQRGDALASQPDSQDPAVLARQKQELDDLTARFKELSAAVLPLGKQRLLLDAYQRTVSNWRSTVVTQYTSELKNLAWRLGGLLAILGVLFAFSELWRRATFRYVQDARRRYQFLLLRRILLWFLVTVIIIVTFASELGSLATFAGLITAGVAVALQNVILSIVGYFFLIGKYGVRVGDRVEVAGVTGDVVEIGLVRLHLMEVGAGGFGARPTGRIVAFSNAVVFQANAGLFKPVPGTKFAWHEIIITLPDEGDYHRVENRMMTAVKNVFAQYRQRIDLEHRRMEHTLTGIPIHSLDPESRLRLTPTGVDVIIRYPVELDQAAEIDDRIARQVLDATEHEAKVKVSGSGNQEEVKTLPAK